MTDPAAPATPPEQRPFRFGLIIDQVATTRATLLEEAKRAADAGVHVLLGTDHLGRYATLPLLQAAAEATGLRIGTFVLNNDLRHPTVLAQELTTLDLVTDGRLEIGLGAGWNRAEYEAAGLAFDVPRRRVDRMVATVSMLKQAMSEGRIEHQADDAYPEIRQEGLPTSVQRPHPPIMIGGGGPRVLRFAAREADIVALDPRSLPKGGSDPNDLTEAAVDRKIAWIREAADYRWPEIEINVGLFDANRGISDEELARSPHYLLGTDVDAMVDTLLERRDRWGISYLAMRRPVLDRIAGAVARLAGS
ncbi:MAG TPA: TIGR03621 family F420-dependent LLM class oxidoreductase [Candidatus Limnocylindria bacterium]|nr:TIGR03621 family F420-dependent LLM class oxidoreductase [Candidatus Limnocylindria bacterium]